jgi:predicted RNA binding protein YcfA (HicA-like mRNA interferase family)
MAKRSVLEHAERLSTSVFRPRFLLGAVPACIHLGSVYHSGVPRKIRQLIADLENAGFSNRGGKGSHRNFLHSHSGTRLTLSGNSGDDAKTYQEKAVKSAIEQSSKP